MSAYSNRRDAAGRPVQLPLVVRAWVGAAMLLTLVAVAKGSSSMAFAAFLAVGGAVVVRRLDSWPTLLAGLVAVIFLIPIKRYEFPVNLPFDLEPYRIAVMCLTLVWAAALLIDPEIRLRRTALDVPMLGFFLALLVSVCLNTSRIDDLGVETDVIKSVSFFASFVIVYFIVATVIRSREDIEFMIRALVLSGAVVALVAVVEFRTEVNFFNRLGDFIPVLEFRGELAAEGITRSDRLRVYASAQHPIALAAAFALLLPLALYVAQTTKKAIWWCSAFLLGLGALATLSRTAIVMIVVAGVVLLVLRPLETKRLLPLALPALVVAFIALPNALGTFKSAFFPKGGIVAEQSGVVPGNELQANNRLADIGPTLAEWSKRPAFGAGYGSRIIEKGPRQNAAILDNQWLGLLLEVGVVGICFLMWLFGRSIRWLGRLARSDRSPLGLLSASLAASIASFGVGMFTFDAFSFVQVTFVLLLLLALAASLLALAGSSEADAGVSQRFTDSTGESE